MKSFLVVIYGFCKYLHVKTSLLGRASDVFAKDFNGGFVIHFFGCTGPLGKAGKQGGLAWKHGTIERSIEM